MLATCFARLFNLIRQVIPQRARDAWSSSHLSFVIVILVRSILDFGLHMVSRDSMQRILRSYLLRRSMYELRFRRCVYCSFNRSACNFYRYYCSCYPWYDYEEEEEAGQNHSAIPQANFCISSRTKTTVPKNSFLALPMLRAADGLDQARDLLKKSKSKCTCCCGVLVAVFLCSSSSTSQV